MHFDPTLALAVIHFAVYATLLTAFFGPRGKAVCGFWGALLSAIAPVVGGLFGNKDKQKKEEAAAKAQADREKADRRATWEEKQSSQSAEGQRLRATYQLGRLLAATGGREKGPKSLISRYETLRTKPTYTDYYDTLPQTNYGAGSGYGLAQSLVSGAGQFAKTYSAEQEQNRQQQKAAQKYDEDQGNLW